MEVKKQPCHAVSRGLLGNFIVSRMCVIYSDLYLLDPVQAGDPKVHKILSIPWISHHLLLPHLIYKLIFKRAFPSLPCIAWMLWSQYQWKLPLSSKVWLLSDRYCVTPQGLSQRPWGKVSRNPAWEMATLTVVIMSLEAPSRLPRFSDEPWKKQFFTSQSVKNFTVVTLSHFPSPIEQS